MPAQLAASQLWTHCTNSTAREGEAASSLAKRMSIIIGLITGAHEAGSHGRHYTQGARPRGPVGPEGVFGFERSPSKIIFWEGLRGNGPFSGRVCREMATPKKVSGTIQTIPLSKFPQKPAGKPIPPKGYVLRATFRAQKGGWGLQGPRPRTGAPKMESGINIKAAR